MNSRPFTRVFIGKIGALSRQELIRECAKQGNILDFLMKEQYAFVVVGISCRNMKPNLKPRRQSWSWMVGA